MSEQENNRKIDLTSPYGDISEGHDLNHTQIECVERIKKSMSDFSFTHKECEDILTVVKDQLKHLCVAKNPISP